MSHTPGPWIADSVNTQDDAVTAVWQNDGRSDYYLRTSQICECFWDSGEDLDIGENRPVNLAEAEANARLIAVAPDLLALCVEMRNWLRPEVVKEPERSFFWKLQNVIDKAAKRS